MNLNLKDEAFNEFIDAIKEKGDSYGKRIIINRISK